jgi:hypothetical protein
MQVISYFSSQEGAEQHVRNLLQTDNVSESVINEYIDCIFSYSSLDDYQGISDEIIRLDFQDWLAE